MQSLTHLDKVKKTFPYIQDKMVIDFVNGLDVAQRLNQHQHETSRSFIKRNLGIISGKTQMAQANINDHLITGLRACQDYFQEISHHQQAHANAVLQLDKMLKQTQAHTAEIAYLVADLKEQVQDIHHDLDNRIKQLEWKDRAINQLENILSAFESERFAELSPMGQCFLVLDTLKWGDFGYYLNQLDDYSREQQLDTLKNRMISIQKSLLGKSAKDDLLKSEWLSPKRKLASSADMQLALQYQGDWSWDNPKNYAMAFTATQFPMLTNEQQAQYQNLVVSMIDIERVSDRMTKNVFAKV